MPYGREREQALIGQVLDVARGSQHDALATVFAQSAAVAADRHRAHRALAEATDAKTDPDRRASHRAHVTQAPSAEVAAALERSAGRTQARAGLAAAAAFPGEGA